MNKGLVRNVQSFSARHLTHRSFVTGNLKNEDVNNKRCDVPIYMHAGTLIRNIRDALRRRIHCSGPIEIWAYADMRSALPKTLIELHNSGVRLRHVPPGNGLKYHVMIADMIAWTADNRPPASAAVITGDPSAGVLYDETPLEDLMDELRVQGYNIQRCLPEIGDPYEEIPKRMWRPAIKELPPPIKEELPWQWETIWPGSTK